MRHLDNDHIMGVLDLLVDLKYQHDTGTRPFLDVGQLWFNSFKSTIDSNDFENRVRAINTIAGVNGIRMQEMSMAVNSIKEGYQLLTVARALNIPINTNTQQGFYLANRNRQTIKIANLEIAVIGPTIKNLEMLRKEWESWIALNEQKIREGKYTKDFAAMADKSIPNLSSMVLLVNADGKSLLFTGDCRGDHLQQGLTETGLSVDGRFHVDIFKVPHHGSRRNTSKRFFEEVTADTDVISSDGTYVNPE